MRNYRTLLIVGIVALLAMCSSVSALENPPFATPTPESTRESRPSNVIVILADDLGYSDLGCYGSEIPTPVLDSLARGGIRFSQFHNTGRCWPTRAALLTGYYPHQINRDKLPGNRRGGMIGRRPAWARLLPEMLKAADFRSYHSGKWHIDGTPLEAGFDHSWWLRDHGRYFSPQRVWQDGVDLPPVPRNSGFYSTTAIADHAIECLREHQQQFSTQPFFSFVAFTAPHFPLHALPEDIERFRGNYDRGWDLVRRDRWSRLAAMDLVRGEVAAIERYMGPPYLFRKQIEQFGPGEIPRAAVWESLSPEQQRFQATKMEIHAAMVWRMDHEIGRILQQVRDMKQWENTLVVFLSDNGASAELMIRDDGHDPNAPPGSWATHLCLGPGWSSASNTPFRKHKTWVHEGGTATPMIVSWPAKVQSPGAISHSVGHVVDLVPSVLHLVGLPQPSSPVARPGQILQLKPNGNDAGDRTAPIFWYHEGHAALRVADYKIVRTRGGPWELYDMATDPCETRNLAALQPGMVQTLVQQWQSLVDQFERDGRVPSDK